MGIDTEIDQELEKLTLTEKSVLGLATKPTRVLGYAEGDTLRKLDVIRANDGVTTTSFYFTNEGTLGVVNKRHTKFSYTLRSSALDTVTEFLLVRAVYDPSGRMTALYASGHDVAVDSTTAAELNSNVHATLRTYQALFADPREQVEHEPFANDITAYETTATL